MHSVPVAGAVMDIGGTLRGARIARGLQVSDVAQRTNLRSSIIKALERGDFEACGGEVYVRGYVRSIATVLDMDATPLLEALGAPASATVLEQRESRSLDIWQLERRMRVPSEWRTWGVLALVVLVVVAIFVWRTRGAQDPPTLDASTLPSVTTSATASVTPELTPIAPSPSTTDIGTAMAPSTPPQETAPTVVQGAIVMTLTGVQTSWVRVTNAAGTLFEGALREGETRSLSSDSDVTVRIGNGAGVSITVNDVTYDNLGAVGEVVTRTFRVG